MGRTRPLTEDDVRGISELHRAVFGSNNGHFRGDLAAYLGEILCGHPWIDASMPSLVREEEGRIVGCLGVMPRRMSIGGRPVRAAVSHTFMVEPSSRGTLAGLELARTFLSGSQDLSLAEGGDRSRRLLEGLGGATALLYSLHWTRPLRPSRYALSFLKRRGLAPLLSAALKPLCYAADTVISWIHPEPLRPPPAGISAQDLSCRALLETLPEVSGRRGLRPDYDTESLRWLLAFLGRKRGRGALQTIAVRDGCREIIGWYLYYLKPGGISEVVQIAAREGRFGTILDHLLDHAWRRGAIAVSGQIEPLELQTFWSRSCVFHHDGASWVLVHSRRQDVLQAIHRGDAFLTRLEGEWWIGP
jgi:GNAT acetyltransferase-like protein